VGVGAGGGSPLLLGGFEGPPPRKFCKNSLQMVRFGVIFQPRFGNLTRQFLA